eukprot:1784634-Lingulodinium_polyedra.AAC.1
MQQLEQAISHPVEYLVVVDFTYKFPADRRPLLPNIGEWVAAVDLPDDAPALAVTEAQAIVDARA